MTPNKENPYNLSAALMVTQQFIQRTIKNDPELQKRFEKPVSLKELCEIFGIDTRAYLDMLSGNGILDEKYQPTVRGIKTGIIAIMHFEDKNLN